MKADVIFMYIFWVPMSFYMQKYIKLSILILVSIELFIIYIF